MTQRCKSLAARQRTQLGATRRGQHDTRVRERPAVGSGRNAGGNCSRCRRSSEIVVVMLE
jgi:hypothetical protein